MHHAHRFGGQAEHFAGDLRHRGVRALPHVDGAAIDDAAAVAIDVHRGKRRGRRHAGLEADGNAAAAAQHPRASIKRTIPFKQDGKAVEDLLDRRVAHQRAGRLRPPVAQQVPAAKLDRIDSQLARHHVGVALVGPHQLRDAEAAQRAGRRQIRVQRVRVDRDVLDVVRARRGEAGLLRHARPDVGVGAAVPPDLALARADAAVARNAALDAEAARVLGDGEELLFHRERDLYRPSCEQREHRHQRLQLDVELGAEAAAEKRHAHADPVLRPAQQPRDLDAHERRALRGGMDGERAVGRLGDRDERLERRVHHLLRAEAVLEHAVRRGERLRGVAAPQVEIERYIRAGPSFQVLQVRERPCRLERVVDDGFRGHRLELVVNGGQLLVFCDDQVRRFLRHVRVGGEHHRDRLADVADLVHREHGLVVERRAVIRVGHDFLQIGGAHHAMHAAHGLGRAHVEAPDPAVRDAAAENPAVQHAGQAQVVDVLGPPGDLQPGLQARQRAPDLRRFSGTERALHGGRA